MSEMVGYIVGESSTSEVTFLVLRKAVVRLFDYVMFKVRDYVRVGDKEELKEVDVVAQVYKVSKKALAPQLPSEAIEEARVTGYDIYQTPVQYVAHARVIGYVLELPSSEGVRYGVFLPKVPPDPMTPVYRASDEILEKLYSKSSVENGVDKGLFIGTLATRPSVKVRVNADKLQRHLAIIAATGAGKTWTSIVLIEELLKKGASILVIDPHGEYSYIAKTLFNRDELAKYGGEYEELYGRMVLVYGSRERMERDLKEFTQHLKPSEAMQLRRRVYHYRVTVHDLEPSDIPELAEVPASATNIREVLESSFELAKTLSEVLGEPPESLSMDHIAKVIEATYRFRARLSPSDIRKEIGRNVELYMFKFINSVANYVFGKDLGSYDNYIHDARMEKLISTALRLLLTAVERVDALSKARVEVERLKSYDIYGGATALEITDIVRPATLTVFNISGLPRAVQTHLVYDVLKRLFDARVSGKVTHPVVVVVEEAHNFAPPRQREHVKSCDIIARIAAEGRKFGICLIVITQRPSKIDPDVLSQCQSQIILRITNPADQRAVREASERISEELLKDLPGLNTGEAVVVGPIAPAPVIVAVRDKVFEYGGADRELVKEWTAGGASPEIYERKAIIRELTGTSPSDKAVERGVELAKNARVVGSSEEYGEKVFNVEVVDGIDTVSVKIYVAGDKVEYSCDLCGEKLCEHTTAAILKLVDEGLLKR